MASSSALMVEGRQRPSVEHLPQGIETSARGDEAVELAGLAGLELDPWQSYVLRTSMSETADGLWSAFLVGVVVGRQNGKGAIIEARELAGLFLPGVSEHLILHSAHEFKTCYEHFLRITQLIEGCPDLDALVQKVRRGVGEQAIELRNGNRLRFIARSSGSGRGMSAPCVILDEAMFLTEAQIGAIMPTLSAQPNPQLWFTSSAPLASSLALHRLRDQAIEGSAERLFYAEWGNDPGVDLDDVEAIARANPALGRRIYMDFIDTEREAMSADEFSRERLGVPEMPLGAGDALFDSTKWEAIADPDSLPTDESLRLALDAPPELTSATFSIAGRRVDGLTHVSIVEHVPPPKMNDLVRYAKALTDRHGTELIIPAGSPARAWRSELIEAGVPLDELKPAEMVEGFGAFKRKALELSLRHRGQPELTNAVMGIEVRKAAEVDMPDRRRSSVNIAPAMAAMAALVRVPSTEPAGEAFFAY